MRIAITGASGNLGSFLTNHFRLSGHDVVEMGRKKSNSNGPWVFFELGKPVDFDALGPVDVFIHAAYDFSALSMEDIIRKNVTPSQELIKQVKAHGVKTIFFISTVSAFEGCKSRYGQGKFLVEKLVSEINGINLRSALMFSAKPSGIVGKLAAVASRLPILPLVGASKKMYVSHLESLADAILQLAQKPDAYLGKTLTMAYFEPYSFKDLITILAKRSGNRIVIIPVYWRLVWVLLFILEKININVGFRSDSLTGLMESSHLKVTEFKDLQIKFKKFEDV